jgi:pyridoxamine 5'-phosphate oxidase
LQPPDRYIKNYQFQIPKTLSSIANIRSDYKLHSLDEKDVAADPFTQFGKWWDEVIKSEITEANAMTLATATPDGIPSARIVLLKGFDQRGFVFYTNYNSHKGKEIANNAHAALVFFWKELERQVRIEGKVIKTSEAESREYFNSRPAGSRIGAIVSPQSETIQNRASLETKYSEVQASYEHKEITLPSHWGGYIVQPTLLEFWQGRPSRLHDRIQYQLENGSWQISRLAP